MERRTFVKAFPSAPEQPAIERGPRLQQELRTRKICAWDPHNFCIGMQLVCISSSFIVLYQSGKT
jgi:hypothetical protein